MLLTGGIVLDVDGERAASVRIGRDGRIAAVGIDLVAEPDEHFNVKPAPEAEPEEAEPGEAEPGEAPSPDGPDGVDDPEPPAPLRLDD